MNNIYRLALQVQDASNPNGVVNSLANEILPGIRAEAGYRAQGTSYINSHPAYLLFLDKLCSLTSAGWFHDYSGAISEAFSACHEAVEADDRERARVEALGQ